MCVLHIKELKALNELKNKQILAQVCVSPRSLHTMVLLWGPSQLSAVLSSSQLLGGPAPRPSWQLLLQVCPAQTRGRGQGPGWGRALLGFRALGMGASVLGARRAEIFTVPSELLRFAPASSQLCVNSEAWHRGLSQVREPPLLSSTHPRIPLHTHTHTHAEHCARNPHSHT